MSAETAALPLAECASGTRSAGWQESSAADLWRLLALLGERESFLFCHLDHVLEFFFVSEVPNLLKVESIKRTL